MPDPRRRVSLDCYDNDVAPIGHRTIADARRHLERCEPVCHWCREAIRRSHTGDGPTLRRVRPDTPSTRGEGPHT